MFIHKKRRDNSEAMLREKTTAGNEFRRDLTGYDFCREEGKRIKESRRLENSYGTIAFGGDKRQGLTILITEKRRHNSKGIARKEKQLCESRQTERPLGRGKTLANPGGQKEGAFAFQYQADVSRSEMVKKIREYLLVNEQETAQRMLPFLAGKEEQSTAAYFTRQLTKAIADMKMEIAGRSRPVFDPQRLAALLQALPQTTDQSADEVPEDDGEIAEPEVKNDSENRDSYNKR